MNMTFLEIVKGILTDREPNEGYFGGATGAIRFVLFSIIFLIGFGIYYFAF